MTLAEPNRGTDICIVTPGYVASTPRVVKEADALTQAGYRVRVVFTQGDLEDIRHHDQTVLDASPWRFTRIGWSRHRVGERRRYWQSTILHHLARKLPSSLSRVPEVAAIAATRIYRDLARAAASEPADLYIGHYPAGLAAAAYAAERRGAKLAYDSEDLHTAELPHTAAGRRIEQQIAGIERRYLRRCAYISAPSRGVAEQLVPRYGVALPTIIHNVFPWQGRSVLDGGVRDRRDDALSLYWYSQTIGLNRGIQDAIRAVGVIGADIQIHLRGRTAPEVRAKLLDLARNHRVRSLYFHDPVPPDELLSRAVEHDVGLALEPGRNLNNELTCSNKLFLYLLSGLAVAATDVRGQRDVMKTAPDAGLFHEPGNFDALAANLDEWRRDPAKLARAKTAALAAARERWNWEIESQKLIECVGAVMGAGRARPRVGSGWFAAT